MYNWFKTMILLTALAGLFMLIGGAVGGKSGAAIALVIALVFNFGSYWFSHKIVLKSYKAREITEGEAPRIYAMVEELSRSAEIPRPAVYRIPSSSPNAFATGRNPSHAVVAVTDGIVDLLDEEELKGVLAHEIAHVKHRDILIGTMAASVASAIMFLSYFARFGAVMGGHGGRGGRGGNPLALLATAIVAPIAAMAIQMAISRSREYGADAAGARFAGRPDGLARALEKLHAMSARVPLNAGPATSHLFIVKPFSGRGLMNLFSTHPPIEKRIARLMEMRG